MGIDLCYMVGILTGQTVSEIIWIWKFVIVSNIRRCDGQRDNGFKLGISFALNFFFWSIAFDVGDDSRFVSV